MSSNTSSNNTPTEYTFDEKMKKENPEKWRAMIKERTTHLQGPQKLDKPLQPRVTHISKQGWIYKV